MQTCLTRIFAGVFALTAFSLLGCSSTNSAPGAGGSSGGEVTSSGGVSAGGTTTNTTDTGGVLPSGGTSASGGGSQAGSLAQGGSDTGGAVTSAAGQTRAGGSVAGGSATGGSKAGSSAAGGSVAGGSATGGKSATGGATTGGSTATGGIIIDGGITATGGMTPTGGKTATGGSTGTTGGSAAAGKTATGGTTTGGTTGGGTGKITIWMSGDSTMSGSGCDGGGWGDQFGSLFNSNVTVQNLSVAGRSIQTWLYEKNVSSTMGANGECTLTATTYSDNWNTMLAGMKAGDWLLVEFGINDGTKTCPRWVSETLFPTYLTTMAKAATDRGAHPIFLTSTSAIECNGSTAQPDRGYGPQTKAAGTADNVPVIDMTVLTAALYTSLGLCPNSSDYTSTTSKVGLFFCGDHTHFEVAGALQIAKTAAQALKDQNIPLASYLAN